MADPDSAPPQATDYLPSDWMGLYDLDVLIPGFRNVLEVPIHVDAVARVVADETRGGYPYLVIEIFWISGSVAHVLRVDEIIVPVTGSDYVPDGTGPNIREHERISLEKVEETSLQLNPTSESPDRIKFTGDADFRTDLPVFLIVSYLNEPEIGYGRPGFGFKGA